MDSTPTSESIEYRINSQGVITYVDAAWTRFALENEAPELVAERVLGRLLLGFISDAETRELYQILLARTRLAGRPLTVTLRCDAPRLRRWLRLTITPVRDGEIRFLSHTVRTEPRDAAPLLERTGPRSDELLRICSWCKRIALDGGRWVEVEEAVAEGDLFSRDRLPQLSHGICPECKSRVIAEGVPEA